MSQKRFLKWYRPADMFIIPLLYLVFGLVLFIFQKTLIYHPDSRPILSCDELPNSQFINHGFRGIFVQAGQKVAVVYHGNAGNACDRSFYAQILLTQGYSTLLVEYPGYGGDSVAPTQKQILGIVPAVSKFVRSLSPTNIVVIGESLGSGVAAYHSKIDSPDHLILITPFDSLKNVVQKKFPIYPAGILLREHYNTAEWAKQTPSVHIIYAENDKTIPPKHAVNLFSSLESQNIVLSMIKNVDHNSIYESEKFETELIKSLP